MVTALGEFSTILNGPVFEDVSLLYESFAILYVAELVIGGQSMNLYCQTLNVCGALQIF